jgi:hypothetical protein
VVSRHGDSEAAAAAPGFAGLEEERDEGAAAPPLAGSGVVVPEPN